ncbi:hypothetical protein GCM10009647_090200 [Streptomyces sanglieri]
MTCSLAGEGGTTTDLVAEYYAQRASAGLIITEGIQPSLVGQGHQAGSSPPIRVGRIRTALAPIRFHCCRIVVGPTRGTASERALTARTFDLAVLQRALG